LGWHAVYCTVNCAQSISHCSTLGDDGSGDEPQQGILVKESESHYSLWCSGRVNCEGLLVELKVSLSDRIAWMHCQSSGQDISHTLVRNGTAI
jgi:hypothetical protein